MNGLPFRESVVLKTFNEEGKGPNCDPTSCQLTCALPFNAQTINRIQHIARMKFN